MQQRRHKSQDQTRTPLLLGGYSLGDFRLGFLSAIYILHSRYNSTTISSSSCVPRKSATQGALCTLVLESCVAAMAGLVVAIEELDVFPMIGPLS
ncbi:hypothetical protein [Petrachloros mirabilis]